MARSEDNKRLLGILKKMVVREKWQRMKKVRGTIVGKTLTKNGNLKLVLQRGKDHTTVYVLKRNKNLFAEANVAKKDDEVSVTLRRYLGRYYCTRITVPEGET